MIDDHRASSAANVHVIHALHLLASLLKKVVERAMAEGGGERMNKRKGKKKRRQQEEEEEEKRTIMIVAPMTTNGTNTIEGRAATAARMGTPCICSS